MSDNTKPDPALQSSKFWTMCGASIMGVITVFGTDQPSEIKISALAGAVVVIVGYFWQRHQQEMQAQRSAQELAIAQAIPAEPEKPHKRGEK